MGCQSRSRTSTSTSLNMSTTISRYLSLSFLICLLISLPSGAQARLSRHSRTKDHHDLASKLNLESTDPSLWTPTSLTSKYLVSRGIASNQHAVQARAHGKPITYTSLTRHYLEKRDAQDGCPTLVVTPPGFQGQCDESHPCPNGECELHFGFGLFRR